MKCILYVSKVKTRTTRRVVPEGLSDIVKVSRKFNEENQITGLLAYNDGRYLQILEGDDAVVSHLVEKIKLDDRHEDVVVILDFPIVERDFSRWDLRMPGTASISESIRKFVKNNATVIGNLNAEDIDFLRPFIARAASLSTTQQKYNDKALALLDWPDFNYVSPSPNLIGLCAALTSRQYSYKSLLQSQQYGGAKELDENLDALDRLNLLTVKAFVDPDSQPQKMVPSSRFFSQMKKYLGLARNGL